MPRENHPSNYVEPDPAPVLGIVRPDVEGGTTVYENHARVLTNAALALRLERIVSTPRHFCAAERNALMAEAARRLAR